MSLQFNLVKRDGFSNITVVVDGEIYVADSEHPLFDEIVDGAVDGDESVVDLFDSSKRAAEHLTPLSERVSVAGGHLFIDQTEVEDVFAEQVIRFLNDGVEDGWPALVNFLEKVYSNTSEDVRENLSRWLKAEQFSILPNGNILGYRGLTRDYKSKHSGPGIVNGERVNGQLDNTVGNVVELDRNLVTHDPSVGCAPGLHVGTHAYAQGWGSGGVVVSVEVDPRNVVSVPYESGDSKMRVTKYKVLDTVTSKRDESVVSDYTLDEAAQSEHDAWGDEDYYDGPYGPYYY